MTQFRRNSDIIIDTLVQSGVSHFFILAGGNAMFLNDAVRKSGIPFTALHHEQAAAMAADAYSKTTGRLSVCLVTSGPGVSNIVTGAAGAFLDSVPVFFIAGQSKSNEQVLTEMKPGVRQFGTFELPGIKLLDPVVKHSYQLQHHDSPVSVVQRMVNTATSGRPGPVFLEVPLDVQSSICTNVSSENYVDVKLPDVKVASICVAKFLKLLGESKKPLIIAGHGVVASGQIDAIRNFAKRFDLRVVTTQLAKEVFPFDSRHFVGHVGVRGDRAGNLAIFNADCILVIGSSLQQQTIGYNLSDFAPKAKLFVLDFEGSVSRKNLPLKVVNYADCSIQEFLSLSLDIAIDEDFFNTNPAWNNYLSKLKNDLAVIDEPHDLSSPEINLYEFVDVLSSGCSEGDIVITDAGLSFYVMGQAFRVKNHQKYIVSGGLGSMGYALPAAIGAAQSPVKERVVAVVGDGSLQMNVQELATLSTLESPVLVYVVNNEGYASIRNSQESFFGPELIGSSVQSGVVMPNWEKIAEAYGIRYLKVEDRSFLKQRLLSHRSISGPALIEVICQPNQKIMPMITSVQDETGRMVSNPLHLMSPLNDDDSNLPQLN